MSDALFRLVGDGDRHSGGAIPLPDAFSAVINHLLDEGSADFKTLNRIISDVLRWKEDRIMAAAWRSWEQFTRDILTVLLDMNLVKDTAQRWSLTIEFVEGYRFFLPGTKIWFVGRKKEARERWEGNESLYLALNSALEAVKDKAAKADPLAIQLVLEAGKKLSQELHLDEKPLTPQQKYYQRKTQRKPHEQGKRLHHGMSEFFRDFWKKQAVPGKWYKIEDISYKFDELHPDQPATGPNSHLQGPMRRVARQMVSNGELEASRIKEGSGPTAVWKGVFRLPENHSGEKIGPYVTYDNLRKGWEGNPKV